MNTFRSSSESITTADRGPDGSPGQLPRPSSYAEIHDFRPGAMAPDQNASLDLGALWGAFRRRWMLAVGLGLALGGCAAAAVFLFVKTPFKAFSEMEIKSVPEVVMFNRLDPPTRFNTYKETLMKKVKGRFVLNAAMRNPKISALSTLREQEPHAIEWLEDNVKVTSPDAEFIQISLQGEKPEELAAIVNAVTEAFQKEIVNDEEGKRGKRLGQNRKVLANLEQDLQNKRTAQRRLAEPLSTSDTKTVAVKQQLAAEYASRLRTELAQLNLDWTRAKMQLAASGGPTDDPAKFEIPPSVIEAQLAADPEYQRATARAAQLDALILQYKDRLAADKPAFQRKQAELNQAAANREELRKKLEPYIVDKLRKGLVTEATTSRTGLKENIELLESNKKHLETELDKYKAEEVKTGLQSFELEMINREIEQTEVIAKVIRDEIKKLEIEMDAPPRITLHREAIVPYVRETDRQVKLAGAAGLALFGMVVAAIVGLEFRARRISTLGEVSGGLRMRVMGTLPLLPNWASNGSAADRGDQWRNVFTESIDSVRTMLLRNTSVDSMRFVMVTSALGNEGKTTLACQLASSLARSGRKTLLVDGDLRQPSVHEVYDIAEAPGLCEVLRGEADLDLAIKSAATKGLSILPAGLTDPQVLKLLSSGEGTQVFDELKKRYDLIIADSSPILPVADSLLLAQHVDGVILSIRRDVSRVGKISDACERLSMLGIPILGAVAIGLGDDLFAYRHSYAPQEQTEFDEHAAGATFS